MGDNRRPITPQEVKILQQEGIDPDNPTVPEELIAQAAAISRIVGIAGGLAVGADYLKDARDSSFKYLEVNYGIGLETVRECWYGGDKSLKEDDLRIELGRRALQSIARSRQAVVAQ